ncbi:beta family protein [Serratia sp. (in: enterobacteria)]|uniref:beta family protein n=1 Tax=Serratia sp. (in: enterobacteria) TaxID=616 RepID=UPI00398A3049
MYPTYVPILKAKKGEFEALANLADSYAQRIYPFFDIGKITEATKKLVKFKNSSQIVKDYLDDTTEKIVSSCKSDNMFFDIFEWKTDSYVETGEHALSYLYRILCKSGMNIIPVIGFDRWDSEDYQNAVKAIDMPEDGLYCIRIDSGSIDDAHDIEYFTDILNDVFDTLKISPKQCVALIDFADVTKKSVVSINTDMEHMLGILDNYNFAYIIMSGGSFPAIINDAVKDVDTTDFVPRREILSWKGISLQKRETPIIFSDYGVRNPNAAGDIIATHANGKIRYTIEDKYFVARGHSKQKGNKGKQQNVLARVIVGSNHYCQAQFSWGDKRIEDCSQDKFSGNSTQWIGIDTNHHITLVVNEILEYQKKIVSSTFRTL